MPPQHLVVASHKPFFLVTAVVVFGCHISRGSNDTVFFYPLRAGIKCGFITAVDGRKLMTQDELAVMDGGKCIFMLRGVRPFFSDKYGLTRHPDYKYIADADKKYLFDMERL